jgi:quercetin dioxygenase-like cupin family protein
MMTKPTPRIAWAAMAMLVLITGFSITHPASAQRDAQGFVRVAPEDVRWVAEKDGSGVERAVIEGDPAKPGLYVIRIKFPPGVMSRNHFHGEDRHATVIKGTWYTGTGDEFAPAKTVGLEPGSYMKHPAGAHHFDGAKGEEVILQIIGIGPSTTTRLRPQEGDFGRSQ